MSNVQWIIPNLEDERGEIEEHAKEHQLSADDMRTALLNGSLVTLTDSMWSSLDNTDSWRTTSLVDVRKLAREYDRDAGRLVSAFQNATTRMPAPLVLRFPDGFLFLLAGNTRLMVCRAMGIRPKILLGSMSDIKELTAKLRRIAMPMKTTKDIKSEGLVLYVREYSEHNSNRQFVLVDPSKMIVANGRLKSTQLMEESPGVLGCLVITMYQNCNEVRSVGATHRYGPTMYHLAMSWLRTKRGPDKAWLRANLSETVTKAARAVWAKFKANDSVDRRPLPKGHIPDWAQRMSALHYDYRLKRSWSLRSLKIIELDAKCRPVKL